MSGRLGPPCRWPEDPSLPRTAPQPSSRPSQTQLRRGCSLPGGARSRDIEYSRPGSPARPAASSPPPAPPGTVVLGRRDDNRKCICRLPSNFLMGASWKRMSCVLPSGAPLLVTQEVIITSFSQERQRNGKIYWALQPVTVHPREPCVPGPSPVPQGRCVDLQKPPAPRLIVRTRVPLPPRPSPNHFRLSAKGCHRPQAVLDQQSAGIPQTRLPPPPPPLAVSL